MPVTIADRLEDLMAEVSVQDLERLPPALQRRVADWAYRMHVLAEMAAAGRPWSKVQRQAKPGGA